jgi:tRNA A-37 threonylcarbamoyl transferase component Bud32
MTHCVGPDSPTLGKADVIDYLRSRGIVTEASSAVVSILSGGVSSDIFDVAAGEVVRVVVKQALPRLKVAGRWEADPARIVTEAAALRLAGDVLIDAVPVVLDLDPLRHVMVIERAPTSFENWKSMLLEGRVDVAVGMRLGTMLAAWHSATFRRSDLVAPFGSLQAFIDLRIRPFYRGVAEHHPELKSVLDDLAIRLLTRHDCLVHGDFSPKNVLTDGDRVWVLDWEVAHLGDPVFDLGFLLAHLLAKSVHVPSAAAEYRSCATSFVDAYVAAAHDGLASIDPEYLRAHTSALLLARVDGTSPADYFTPEDHDRARAVAISALTTSVGTPDELWDLL